ncbi:MAG: hypothetical protein K0S21_3461 [Rhizobiaceae bacterium]|nr:hypothetical protein [Rhizobiaceae bacterium]
MAKQKSKALPKRIASVKIPKSIRRSKTLRSLIANPVGREILAGALVAGAGAAATILLNEREALADGARKEGKKGARAMEIAREAMKGAAAAMVAAVASNGSFKGKPEKAKAPVKSTH